MKNKIIILVALICLLAGCDCKVKPGQIWVVQYNVYNPFSVPIIKRRFVIAVERNYVQYKDIDSGNIYDEEIRWFKMNSKKIR